MKYLKQFLIILAMSFLGELLKYLLPLPIPASIYGMALMLFCLMTKIIKLESVRDTGYFLIEIMPVMFIPAGVGLLESWGVLRGILVPVSVVTIVVLIVVMIVTGHVSQIIIKNKKRQAGIKNE